MSDYLKQLREEKINGRPAVEKKRKWLKPVSEKRAAQNEQYKIRRLVFLAANPKCQCGREGCNRKAVEIHHAKGRVGANFLDEKTWRAVARVCHRWAEMNPNEAKKAGLSENRL